MEKIHHIDHAGKLSDRVSAWPALSITLRFLIYLVCFAGMLTPARVPAQTPIVNGYKDFNFGSQVVHEPTGEKNQSKLWWNDGLWWGILWNKTAKNYQIYRFEVPTQSWINSATVVDNRKDAKSDVLWDGQYLYVASNIYSQTPEFTTPENSGRLYRFNYDLQSRSYTLDPGFPVPVNNSTSETITIDKDSRGKLWVTWTQEGKVKINCSTGNDQTWGVPFDLPVQGNDAKIDDISTIIAFEGGNIGIMWSNQNDKKTYFAVHHDDEPANTWEAREEALADPQLGSVADDHIHLKRGPAGSGEVYAVTKTEIKNSDEPGIFLLKRNAGGIWTRYQVATVDDGYTRPILLIEEDSRELHVVATSKKYESTDGKIIRIKSTALDNINFEPGVGVSFIQSATDSEINDATSTKQAINETTGMLVLTADKTTDTYYHNYLDLGAGKPLLFSFSPTEGSGGTVVTISGLHFAETSAVLFDGIPASDFSVVSDNTLEVTVPDSVVTGPISVSNSSGTATSSDDFIVDAAAPLLTAIPNQLLDEGAAKDISVTAIDPNGDGVALAVNNLPPFGSFTDHGDGTGTIYLAPGFEDGGNYSGIEVTATDDGIPPLSSAVVFEVTVNQINRKPLLSALSDQIIREGDTAEVEISAGDPDGDQLTITLPDLPVFGNFSSGENGQGVVTFQPQYGDMGSYLIKILVTDDGTPVLTDSASFLLTVNEANQAPNLSSIPDQQMAEGDTLTVPIIASDDEGDNLMYRVDNLPSFGVLLVNRDGSAAIRFIPGFTAAGVYDKIEVVVWDDGLPSLSISERFALTVGDKNRPPLAGDDTVTTAEDTPAILDVLSNDGDPDGHLLFLAGLLVDETIGSATIAPGNTTITYQPAPDFSGTDRFTYVVGDGHGGLDTARVIMTVLPVNDAPVLKELPDLLVLTVDAISSLNIWQAAEDVETPDRELVFHFMVLPDILVLNYDEDTGILEISAKDTLQSTAADLVITVSDSEQESTSHTINIQIEPLAGFNPSPGSIPGDYILGQNYPNPFNPATTIQFGLPRAGKVRLEIYTLLGERVAVLVDEYKEAGFHIVTWDGRDLASGIYLYRIQAEKFQALKKMILLK